MAEGFLYQEEDMREKTIDAAKGRWREILPQLGVARKFLSGRHGPCPICGGKDRFRFDDRTKNGDYYCNQCGSGLGIKLVMKVNDWDFKTAARAVDEVIGNKKGFVMGKTHRAAREFFDAQPDRQELRSQARLNILLDENISFESAMKLLEMLPRKVS